MLTLTAVWFLVGFIIILGMLILSILKQMKWKTFGISISIYLIVLFFMFVIAGSQSNTTTTSSEVHSSRKSTNKKTFKIISQTDETGDYQTDKNGNFDLKIKGIEDGTVKITCEDNEVKSFNSKIISLKKGQIVSIPIELSTDDLVPTFILTASNGYHKKLELYNNSDTVNSSMSEKESSESQTEKESESQNSSDSYQASLNTRKDNWNNSSDGDVIHVAKVWQDMHTTFIAVNEEDWNTLSEADKNSFTSDWTSSVQDIYKMSDKNGTTSIQIVSSSNHDHMLAHSTGSGKIKIDD